MDFSRLDAFLDRLTAWRMPGNDCIIIKDGKIVHRHQSGYADVERGIKMNGNETYNMWSCSKPLTCAAALTLVEKGDITLPEPVETYLPEFADVMVREVDEDGNEKLVKPRRKITVRDLFSMSTGYSYDTSKANLDELKARTGGRCPTREVMRSFAKMPLNYHPGEVWQYGISHDILAALVEVVSGERFNSYVKRVIFDPLEMHDSTYSNPSADLLDRMARQYTYDEGRDRLIPSDNSVVFVFGSEYDSGGAGLISTCADYAKFAAAMANGGVGMNGARILSRHSIDLMRADAMKGKKMLEFGWMHLHGYSYGLGVRTMVDISEGGSTGSVGEFGWAGAAGSYVSIDPDRNLAIVYTQHMLNSQEEYFTPRLRNIVNCCID